VADRASVRHSADGTIRLGPGVHAKREIYCSANCGQTVVLSHDVPPRDTVQVLEPPTAECGCGTELAHRLIIISTSRRSLP
jgi:hypothetical protein